MRDLIVEMDYVKGRITLTPHLPRSWGWREVWDNFTTCCKTLAKVAGTEIYFSPVSHYALMRAPLLYYNVVSWAETADKVLPTAFTLLSAKTDLEMLFILAPHILPEVEVHGKIAIVWLRPIQNYSFPLPYPIPHIVYTDDIEQLYTLPSEAEGQIGGDLVTVGYRGYLRQVTRHISDGFLLFMSYIVLYYALLENKVKLFTSPSDVVRKGVENLLEEFVEGDIITRRLLAIAESESLPLDIRTIAWRLYTERTRKPISPHKEVRAMELLVKEMQFHSIVESFLQKG